MNHRRPRSQSYVPGYRANSAPSSWDVSSPLIEGKVIEQSVSACCADWNLSWHGWKQKSSPRAGSHNRFWLSKADKFGQRSPSFENLCTAPKCGIHTSCLKVFYKASCWEDILLFSLSLPCLRKVVCSVSELQVVQIHRGGPGWILTPGQHLGSAAGRSD